MCRLDQLIEELHEHGLDRNELFAIDRRVGDRSRQAFVEYSGAAHHLDELKQHVAG